MDERKLLRHDFLSVEPYASKLKTLKRLEPIIDIGPGIRPCPLWGGEHLCIEPCEEYADVLLQNGYNIRTGTAIKILPSLPRVGTVLMLDVIEHMEREEGKRVRDMLEEWPRAVIFTPNGFMEQSGEVNGKDAWGLNGQKWQRHRSGWFDRDFPNWRVHYVNKGLLCFRL